MEFTFTTQDAQVLYGFLASALVPLIVGWLSRSTWPAWARFALAVLVSVLMAALSQYAAGALSTGSFIVAIAGVFTVSQGFFASWFKGLGFERWLNPEMQAPETELERNVRLYALLRPSEKSQQELTDLGVLPTLDLTKDLSKEWEDSLSTFRARQNRPKAEDDAGK